MEPPSTPRKPRRTKATPENSQDTTPDSAAPASTPKRRTTAKSEATPKPRAPRKKATSPASTPSSELPPPTPVVVEPVSEASSVPVPAPSTELPPPVPVVAAIADDEPDIFKPLPPQATPAPSNVAVTSSQSVTPQEGADRYMKLLRTWTTRNVEIVRKSFSDTSASVDTSGEGAVNNMAQRSTSSLDSSLEKLQKQLETSDSAVLIATLVFIVVCMAATLLLSAAFGR